MQVINELVKEVCKGRIVITDHQDIESAINILPSGRGRPKITYCYDESELKSQYSKYITDSITKVFKRQPRYDSLQVSILATLRGIPKILLTKFWARAEYKHKDESKVLEWHVTIFTKWFLPLFNSKQLKIPKLEKDFLEISLPKTDKFSAIRTSKLKVSRREMGNNSSALQRDIKGLGYYKCLYKNNCAFERIWNYVRENIPSSLDKKAICIKRNKYNKEYEEEVNMKTIIEDVVNKLGK